jgi:hypothetical protein
MVVEVQLTSQVEQRHTCIGSALMS